MHTCGSSSSARCTFCRFFITEIITDLDNKNHGFEKERDDPPNKNHFQAKIIINVFAFANKRTARTNPFIVYICARGYTHIELYA